MVRFLIVLVVAIAMPLSMEIPAGTHAAVATKKHCKTVKKHGKKTKVCTTVKKASKKPTSTPVKQPAPAPTGTPQPTAVPVPTAAPVPTSVTPGKTIAATDFALSPSDFPKGSEVEANQVESNQDADANDILLHFGSDSRAAQGRVTGYFMETLQQNLDAGGTAHPTLIYYLVSIFGTSDQAAAAWKVQRQGWSDTDTTGGSCGTDQPLGDLGYSCTDSRESSRGTLRELFFKRGRVLVEVWVYGPQDAAANYTTAYFLPAARAAHDIGAKLDAKAQASQ